MQGCYSRFCPFVAFISARARFSLRFITGGEYPENYRRAVIDAYLREPLGNGLRNIDIMRSFTCNYASEANYGIPLAAFQ